MLASGQVGDGGTGSGVELSAGGRKPLRPSARTAPDPRPIRVPTLGNFRYTVVFDHLRAEALGSGPSVDLIARVAAELA
jgi:hypothetical protein